MPDLRKDAASAQKTVDKLTTIAVAISLAMIVASAILLLILSS